MAYVLRVVCEILRSCRGAGHLLFGIAFWVVSAALIPQSGICAGEDALVLTTFRAKYADVSQLEPILRTLLSDEGSLSVDARTGSIVVHDIPQRVDTVARALERLDLMIPSHTFQLDYAEVDTIAEKIRRILGTDARIVESDTRTHTVYVLATPSRLEEIKMLVSRWDRPPRQVLIEADILDVSAGKLKELGIEWEARLGYAGGDHDAVLNVGTQRSSQDKSETGSVQFGTPTVRIPAVFDAAGGLVAPEQIIPGSDFSATIEALVEDRSTRTLSRPRILVLDGHPARFEVSTLEPYANTRYTGGGVAASLDIQFLDIGIILETIPHISDKGWVMLDVRPEVSTLERDEFFDTTIIPDEGGSITNRIRVPVKAQSRAVTTIMVHDDQTIAIGGLRTNVDTESVRKVPLLGDIPVLGIPFRNLNQGSDTRELIIFITPHIISGDESSAEARLLEEDRAPSGKERAMNKPSRQDRTSVSQASRASWLSDEGERFTTKASTREYADTDDILPDMDHIAVVDSTEPVGAHVGQ